MIKCEKNWDQSIVAVQPTGAVLGDVFLFKIKLTLSLAAMRTQESQNLADFSGFGT